MKYNPQIIEAKWQQRWAEQNTNRTPNPGEPGFDASRPKFYVLDMFPYPSGVGLHVGHPLGYIATDIVARYKRMRGCNVLHPMGFDAFGLPAEQYAVEHNVHPAVTTQQNIDNMVRQLKRLGLGYDWGRQLSTTDTDYYRWTQWVFTQLFNSYFDPIEQRAMPISHLLDKLVGEDYVVDLNGELVDYGSDEDLEAIAGPRIGVLKWHELDAGQQQRFLDEYRLAYLAEVEVNWCPALGTVLANEEVTSDGRSERGNHPVQKRPLKQWMLRITAYADRLIDDLQRVDWPEATKALQRNWIGKSLGAEVTFEIGEAPATDSGGITVFTTRPDTLFGATYMVLAPEHPLVDTLTTDDQRDAVGEYRFEAMNKSSIARQAGADKDKTGVFTGSYAKNPVNQQRIPVWIADYVMMTYGTGAIMAVPAHDARDHAFASKFNLPIVQVIQPQHADAERSEASGSASLPYTGNGTLIHSANEDFSLDGLDVPAAKAAITAYLEALGIGRAVTQFKLRDWLFSRQRYWGEPFPILHGPDGQVVTVDEADLPVELPPMDDFRPTPANESSADAPPSPPLGRAPVSWRKVIRDGEEWSRELNTMPQWAGSCWYYLRFCDPSNDERFVGREAEGYWMGGSGQWPVASGQSGQSTGHWTPDTGHSSSGGGGVDLYVGGVEHAVLHLLYARFWHKVLYDLGHVSTPEPFAKLFNQGYIQAYAYLDERGIYVPAIDVTNADGKPAYEVQGQPNQSFFFEGKPVTERYGKMGKSLKNAVAPDEVCEQYGADTLRLYEMYMGPLDQSKPWNPSDIVGVHRFLHRLWRNFIDAETGALRIVDDEPSDELRRLLHKTIARVTDAMDAMSFNVAIAALIELNNALVPLAGTPRGVAQPMVRMLAPLAPHIAEELWQHLGHDTSVTTADWPNFDPALLVESTLELPVQVNGKLRGRVTVPANADEATVLQAAKEDPNVATHLQGKTIRKQIVIPGKLVNLVVG